MTAPPQDTGEPAEAIRVEATADVAEDPAPDAGQATPPGLGGQPPPRRWRLRWPSKPIVEAGAVVGLIGGIAGLVFTFFPGLTPGGRETTTPTADLELADVNGGATLREYLNAEGIPPGTLSPDVLKRMGVLATVRYTSSGLDGKELPLVVSLASRETGVVVCKHTYRVNAGSGAPLTFRSWSPFPAAPKSATGSYNLHVTLFPPDGQPPSLDADDENDIAGGPVSGPPIPLDLC